MTGIRGAEDERVERKQLWVDLNRARESERKTEIAQRNTEEEQVLVRIECENFLGKARIKVSKLVEFDLQLPLEGLSLHVVAPDELDDLLLGFATVPVNDRLDHQIFANVNASD